VTPRRGSVPLLATSAVLFLGWLTWLVVLALFG
jgi:hypothetical protein